MVPPAVFKSALEGVILLLEDPLTCRDYGEEKTKGRVRALMRVSPLSRIYAGLLPVVMQNYTNLTELLAGRKFTLIQHAAEEQTMLHFVSFLFK